MAGERVIVRAFGGEPLIRCVWGIGAGVIYITNGAKDGPGPIGFPKEDIFKFDNHLAPKMKHLYDSGKWDWSKLKPF